MNIRCVAVSILAGLVNTCVYGQSSTPTPPPEIKKWEVWIGDWNLSGTAKDTPTGPEYKVNWHLHEHWVLNGFFVQVDQTWQAKGQELHSMEILSYDRVKKVHTVTGFSDDGSTWALTATFNKATTTEEGVARGPEGAIVHPAPTGNLATTEKRYLAHSKASRTGSVGQLSRLKEANRNDALIRGQ